MFYTAPAASVNMAVFGVNNGFPASYSPHGYANVTLHAALRALLCFFFTLERCDGVKPNQAYPQTRGVDA